MTTFFYTANLKSLYYPKHSKSIFIIWNGDSSTRKSKKTSSAGVL